MRLFKRRAVLTVDVLQIDSAGGLDYQFTVDASTKKEPNTAEIMLYNLSEERRQELERKSKVTTVLEAGYEEAGELHELFRGDLEFAETVREGSDLITKLQSGDGERAYRGSRVSGGLRRGATVKDAARRLAGAMKADAGNLVEAFKGRGLGGVTDQLESGTVFDGSTADELDRLTRSAGLEWSIQGGAIQATPRGRGLPGDPILLTSDFEGEIGLDQANLPVTRGEGANTGLIGSPSVDSDGNIRATALIVPGLVPGRRVKVQSKTVEGIGYVREARYNGSSFGNEWRAELLVVPEGE